MSSRRTFLKYEINSQGYSFQLYQNNDVGGQTPTHGEIIGSWQWVSGKDSLIELSVMPFSSTLEALVSEEVITFKPSEDRKSFEFVSIKH